MLPIQELENQTTYYIKYSFRLIVGQKLSIDRARTQIFWVVKKNGSVIHKIQKLIDTDNNLKESLLEERKRVVELRSCDPFIFSSPSLLHVAVYIRSETKTRRERESERARWYHRISSRAQRERGSRPSLDHPLTVIYNENSTSLRATSNWTDRRNQSGFICQTKTVLSLFSTVLHTRGACSLRVFQTSVEGNRTNLMEISASAKTVRQKSTIEENLPRIFVILCSPQRNKRTKNVEPVRNVVCS